MLKIIINADDFGLNASVTEETAMLIEKGLISSATIMANGVCLNDVALIAKNHPEISYGVHICLDEFESLTHNPVFVNNGITDKDGFFIKGAIFEISDFNSELLDALEKEIKAQIERILLLGIPISHIDSHHLVHTRIRKLVPLFFKVLDEYNIKKIRLGEITNPFESIKERFKPRRDNNTHVGTSTVNNGQGSSICGIFNKAIHHSKILCLQRLMNKEYKRHFITTDVFYYYSQFLDAVINRNVKRYSSVELMCHPGHPSVLYKEEICNIERLSLKDHIEYQLISYNEL